MPTFNWKIVFISGASSGIGKACAEAYAKDGAKLILCARSVDKLEALAAELKQRFQTEVICLKLDVGDRAAVNAAVDTLPEEWQKIDILINSAGGALGLEKIQEGDLDDWDAHDRRQHKGAFVPDAENSAAYVEIRTQGTCGEYRFNSRNSSLSGRRRVLCDQSGRSYHQ